MKFTEHERRILAKALGERGVQIMQDTGVAGIGLERTDLTDLNVPQLAQALRGALVGVGMAMADAQHMFERAGLLVNEIASRAGRVGHHVPMSKPIEPETPASRPKPRSPRRNRATRPVRDDRSGTLYPNAAAAAEATGLKLESIHSLCGDPKGRFNYADAVMEGAV